MNCYTLCLILTFCLSDMASCAEVLLAQVFDMERGSKTVWTMDSEKFRRLPRFTLDGRPPIDMVRAIDIARKRCAGSLGNKTLRFARLTFQEPVRSEMSVGVFFYVISFDVTETDGSTLACDVVVLPDGSILEPRKERIGRKE